MIISQQLFSSHSTVLSDIGDNCLLLSTFVLTPWPHNSLLLLSCYGSHSFAICGPAPCNSLPAAVQDLSSSSSCFCSHLKTELFSTAYDSNSLQYAHDLL